MVKCNKYVLLRGRRHAPTFARPPISPALTQCQLFSDSESTRIRSRDVLRHECRMETQIKSLSSSVGQCCSSSSKLVEQQRGGCSSCIARQQRLYAAAAAAGLAESSDPACYETQAAERSHEEPGSGQQFSTR